MDRLSTLIGAGLVALFTVVGCTSKPEADAEKPPSRVIAVAGKKRSAQANELCDYIYAPNEAPTFSFPKLHGDPGPAAKTYRWVNVWATWCPPCVEELSLIRSFRDQQAQQKAPFTLTLLSVDTADSLEKFARAHPQAHGSLRVDNLNELERWLKEMGLDAAATLPIHLFVDPKGRVRCLRTGSIEQDDLALVKQLFSAG